jgi:response regulator RpfG family c-di-GMP phosphodiesterase
MRCGFSIPPMPGCLIDLTSNSKYLEMSRLTPESEAVFSEALLADPLRAPDASLPFRLLIVDDDESMRKLMSSVLAGAGVESKSASSGHEALRILEVERFDAVISDLAMPGMTGIELLNEVRRSHPRTAFLIVSGAGDIRIGVQAMREGCDDYIVKPFQIDAVMAAVERALRKRGLEQEVQRYRLHLEEIVVERTLQLRTALNGIERSYEDTLGALGAAIDLRDNETGDHSRRVCLYSIEIARAMCVPKKDVGTIARGACLHDIGKLAIPDGILLKPGPLTLEERRTMQTHASIGHGLVNLISFLAEAAEIVLSHHERYDGSGYPHGLRKEQIPLGARIFSVADTVDAMTSDRPYRRALPFHAAFEEIESEAGRKYDPAVAKIFLGTRRVIWDAIRKGRPKSD